MMDYKYEIITTLTVIFFIAPVLWVFIKRQNGFQMKISDITALLNFSIILQICLGTLLYTSFLIFGKTLFGNLLSDELLNIMSSATVWYYLIGIIYYIPGLLVLNLINWITKVINKRKEQAHNNV